MEGLDHSYFIHHIYNCDLEKDIQVSLCQIQEEYSIDDGQYFEVLCEKVAITPKLQENNDNCFIIDEQVLVVEWKLQQSNCLSLDQLIELSQEVISITQNDMSSIIQSIISKLQSQDWLQTLVYPSNCWIILNNQSGKFGQQICLNKLLILIIPSDGSLLVKTHIKREKNLDLISLILKYCNDKLSKLFDGEYQMYNNLVHFYNINLKESNMKITADINKLNQFYQNIQNIKKKLKQETSFDKYFYNLQFINAIFNESKEYQIDFMESIDKNLRMIQRFINPKHFINIENPLLQYLKNSKYFNSYNYRHPIFTDHQKCIDEQRKLYQSIKLTDLLNNQDISNWKLIKKFKIHFLTQFKYDLATFAIDASSLENFEQQHQYEFNDALFKDLQAMFQLNFKQFQFSQQHLSRFYTYFFEIFFPTIQMNQHNLYIGYQFEKFQEHINYYNQKVLNFLCNIRVYKSKQEFYEEIIQQQQDENFSNQINDKIFAYSRNSGLSQDQVNLIKVNFAFIFTVITNYLSFLEKKYQEKLLEVTISSNAKYNNQNIFQQWYNLILEKRDIVEVLILKHEFSIIIIRDLFEQQMKDIIDKEYNNILTERLIMQNMKNQI